MSLADIKAKLSTKGLRGSGPRTPLRHFKGMLKAYDVVEVTYGQGDGARTGAQVQLDFVDVEVIESTEPYDFPVGQIALPHSESETSRWGVFSLSANKFIPASVSGGDTMGWMVGKMIEMHYMGGGKVYNRDQGGVIEVEAWQVVGIDGGGTATVAVDPLTLTLSLLDGKTLQQFQMEAMKNQAVRESQYGQEILNASFIPNQTAAGRVSVDDNNIYHVSV